MKRDGENSPICTSQSKVLVRDKNTTLLDEIMKDLTEPNMNIFGVYGLRISSKMVLMAQMKKRVVREGLFDAVVTASQITNGDLEGIQRVLGNQLCLHDVYGIASEKERARRLSDKIKTKEKILFILVLDDLKGGIDLGEIGIPFGNDHKGSKILLIAQTRHLLSHKMKTQKEYSVEDDDAEELDSDSDKRIRRPVSLGYSEIKMLAQAADLNDKVVFSVSVKTKLDEIEMALKQPNMRIVGVYGSSEGRKLVVDKIQKRLEKDGVCDEAVHVMASTMKKKTQLWRSSKSLELEVVRRIQEELANKLGVQFHLHDKTMEKRATFLCDTIKTKGNILIILDDLQDPIDLAEIGIPFGNDHLGSKILLLAQTHEVISNQMNAPQAVFCADINLY